VAEPRRTRRLVVAVAAGALVLGVAAPVLPALSAETTKVITVSASGVTVTALTAKPTGSSVAFNATLAVGSTALKVDEVAFAVRAASNPVDSGALDPTHRGASSWAAGSAPTLTATRVYPEGAYTVNIAYRVGANWMHVKSTTVPFTVGAAPTPATSTAPGATSPVVTTTPATPATPAPGKLAVASISAAPSGSSVAFSAKLIVGGEALAVDELAFAVRDADKPVDSGALDPTHLVGSTLQADSSPSMVGARTYPQGDYTVNVAYRVGSVWTHIADTVDFTVTGTTAPSTPVATVIPKAEAITPAPSAPIASAPVIPTPSQSTGAWLSGSSGEDVANGVQGNWRGAPIQIAGTWITAEDLGGTIGAGREYGDWKGSVDLGLPLISGGQTYGSCATGACDAGWEKQIQALKSAWTRIPRDGTLFVRLSWEMNGNWYPHKVTGSTAGAFAASWKRFDAIRDRVFPEMKLVFGTSSESSGDNNLDWRQAVPGYSEGASEVKKYVDVISTDFYNEWWSQTRSETDWNRNLVSVDWRGAPRGLESYRQFAESVGLPFAISEWSNVASGTLSGGDQPSFVQGMYDFVKSNAGTGAGKVIYEIQFNVKMQAGGKFVMGPSSLLPNSSATYKDLF
jgi:hypothetical protein